VEAEVSAARQSEARREQDAISSAEAAVDRADVDAF
jgi:hypothetical protein